MDDFRMDRGDLSRALSHDAAERAAQLVEV